MSAKTVRFRMRDGSVVTKDRATDEERASWAAVLADPGVRLLMLVGVIDRSGRTLPEIWVACDDVVMVEVGP